MAGARIATPNPGHTMTQASLPDLSQSTAQLSADNDRIMQFTDRLPSRVDKIVEAALTDDWTEVRRLAEFMIRPGDTGAGSDVSARARQLCEAIDQPNNRVGIQQSLIRLIGACGAASDTPPRRDRLHTRGSDKRVR